MSISEAYTAKLDELTAWTQEAQVRHEAYRDAVRAGMPEANVAAAKALYDEAKNAVDEATADVWEMIESGEAMDDSAAAT